jgi:ribosomal-protein-alanine N-acetyltransferase
MSVRRATAADAPILSALHGESFPVGWSAAACADLLNTPGTSAVLADGGFAVIRTVLDEAELLTLAVAPAARRQGLGRRLLDAAMRQARSEGADTVHLEVAASNAPALRLYEQAGFERSGLRRNYYARPNGAAEDAVLMRRALNTSDPSPYPD